MRLRKKLFQFAKKIVFWRNWLSYQSRGRKPWSRGYFEYKWSLVEQALRDPQTMGTFCHEGSLPGNFGQRVDERIVEYPWVLTHLPDGPAQLLDAGSALNFEKVLSHPTLADKQITITTLHPETSCFWYRDISYLFSDLRNLPFKSDAFDLITCISTLEHIGMDNTKIYTANPKYKEKKTEDYLVALAELKRVLKTKGTLLITVPFGQYHDFGFFQQFNHEMIQRLITTFAPSEYTLTFYAYLNGGWQISNLDQSATAKYVTADRAKKDPSLAAAASAVACLKLVK